ncbi:MAG TPA: c-type cytochrome [Arenibaculum sp.]|nr:c-type cytochrome [Arenibaculum sp.]
MTRYLPALLAAMAFTTPAWAGDAQPTGRALAQTCYVCHGPQGHSPGPIPALHGQSAEQIASALTEYKAGTRPATIMSRIAQGYSDESIKLVADYLASQN